MTSIISASVGAFLTITLYVLFLLRLSDIIKFYAEDERNKKNDKDTLL